MNSAIGNSKPIHIGGKIYLVGYVSMAEWQTFGDLQGKVFSKYALLYLIYSSLHRANPQITRRDIRRLFRWHRKHIPSIIEVICDISIPKAKKDEKPSKVLDIENERNIKTVYRLLSRLHGWTPNQIDNMSPTQVYIYLTGGSAGTGIQRMTSGEYQNFLLSRRMQRN